MSFSDLLRTIDDGTPASRVARWIAGVLLESDAQPYCFSINHDTSPPKCLACPLQYDWTLKNQVGIDTMDRFRAWQWIVDALMQGYMVARADPRTHYVIDNMTSVERERYAAKSRRLRATGGKDGDDIPF